jgi:hypothetical protein
MMPETRSAVVSPVTEKVWSEHDVALTAVGVMLAVLYRFIVVMAVPPPTKRPGKFPYPVVSVLLKLPEPEQVIMGSS